MSEPDFVPEQPAEKHFQIGQLAADRLGRLVDGNGLKAEQVRLGKHDTLVHQLPGAVRFELKPDVMKEQLKGNRPTGKVLGSEAAVMGEAAGLATAFLADKDIQIELLALLEKDPGRGWGIQPFKHPLAVTRREFCVIDKCIKCNGQASYACVPCNSTGAVPCNTCMGSGMMQCPICFGAGQMQLQDGSRGPCTRCASIGRVPCLTCQGMKQLRCNTCAGQTRIACTECDRSGYWTHTFEMTFHAEAEFLLDRQQMPLDVQAIVDRLGERQLATEQHAEIFRLIQNPELKFLVVPYLAFLPLAEVEFSIEGKPYPAGVAGLTGRIMGIDPVLDGVIKPGINALFKLSKGPLAAEALIDQACKFRVIRQVISGLAHHSKRLVYQGIIRDYPLVLSEKYAKAVVKYAEVAILAISKGPRIKGLVLGTILSAALSAGYYLTPARQFALQQLMNSDRQQLMPAIDLAVWGLSWVAAWMTIRLMAAGGLKKMLPDVVQSAEDKGLPTAGPQGMVAVGTTLVASIACSFFALVKPEWVQAILKMVTHH